MVDFSHLSAGNSLSSPSRELFADLDFSNPSSPTSLVPDPDMAESVPVPLCVNAAPGLLESAPLDHEIGSDESTSDVALDMGLLPLSAQDTQDIFKAAHHFSHQDRLNMTEERKKNMDLTKFISAHGFSMQAVNDYLQTGKLAEQANAHNVIDKSSKREDCSRTSVSTVLGSLKPLADNITPVLTDFPRCDHAPVDTLASSSIPPPNSSDALKLPEGKKSWSSIVTQSELKPKVRLEYFPPSPPLSADGPIIVKPPRDVLMEGMNRWDSSLVGGFLNGRLPFKLVEENVHKLWDKYGLQRVVLQEKGFFVFQFSKPEDRANVLALGPWYISNKLLILKYWKEGIDFLSEACTNVPIWVKFHLVPLSYWTPKGLSFLASSIGKPLLLDKTTEELVPMKFARICIEVTPSSAFPDKLNLVVFDKVTDMDHVIEVKVEYQNKPQICSHCKSFGHSLTRCPSANYKWIPKSSHSTSASSSVSPDAGILPCPILVMADAPPSVPSHVGSSSDAWTVVSKGSKLKSVSAPLDNEGSNPFSSLVEPPTPSPSDLDATPTHNPLVDKLKIVDEKEGRDLKNKARSFIDYSQKSKKKPKGGGGNSKTPT